MSRANARPRIKKSLSSRKTSPSAIHMHAPAGSKTLRKFYEAKHGRIVKPYYIHRNPIQRAKTVRIWYSGLKSG